jgi:hypothetical protein
LDLRHRHKAVVIIWPCAENLAGGADSGDTMNRLSSQSARGMDAAELLICDNPESGKRDDFFAVDVMRKRILIRRYSCVINFLSFHFS